MAGLFDFKSAEDILQERMAKTEENRLQMLRDVSQGADRPEVVRLGANLGYLLGKSLFGGKSEKEQLKETREMGETTQAMEQAGVGGEGSAQFDGEGSSYGAGVLQQAKAEEQRRLGLLPQEMQDAIEDERQKKALQGRMANLNPNDPESYLQIGRELINAGLTEQGLAFIQQSEKLRKAAREAHSTFGQQAKDLGLTPGTPEFTAKVQELIDNKQAGVSVVNKIGGDELSAEEQIALAAQTKFAEEVAKKRAVGIAAKEAEDIVVGASAAEQMPLLLDSIGLLQTVSTGNVEGVALKAKQVLGIETADEAELINALEKGVISQLKSVFGSQFTAKEGQWLRDIEANIGKSTKGNIRLLERGLELARQRAKVGIEAANDAGDFRSRRQIEDVLLQLEGVEPETEDESTGGVDGLNPNFKRFLP